MPQPAGQNCGPQSWATSCEPKSASRKPRVVNRELRIVSREPRAANGGPRQGRRSSPNRGECEGCGQRHGWSTDVDGAPVGGSQTHDDPQEGGLACAFGSDQPGELSGRDGERDTVEDPASAEAYTHFPQLEGVDRAVLAVPGSRMAVMALRSRLGSSSCFDEDRLPCR
jgi:hypothetical protein